MEEKGKVTCTLTGGIGHMLFQLAHCLTYAKENNLIAHAPFSRVSPAIREGLHLDDYFFDEVDANFHDIVFPCLFNGDKQNMGGYLRLVGEVQGEKWFDPELEWLKTLRPGKKEHTVGLHFRGQEVLRKGDYTLDYRDVRETLFHIARPGDTLHIFTDTPRHVVRNVKEMQADLGYIFSDIIYHESHPLDDSLAISDLFTMAAMDRLICSPSCFSWWGAWLGGSDEVYWPDTSSRGSERRYMVDLKLPRWKWLSEVKKEGRKPELPGGKCEMLVIVQSCRKYKNRRDTCRRTWLSHLPEGVKYFFAVGGGGTWTKPSEVEPDTVFLPCPDDYLRLHYKTREMFRYALQHYSFDYVLKCDDDSYIVLDRAQELGRGQAFLSDPFVGATGGGGYFLSRESVEGLVLMLGNSVMGYTPEDIMVTDTMIKLGVRKGGTERIQRHCHHYVPTAQNDYVSSHYVYDREADAIEHLLYSHCLYAYCWIDNYRTEANKPFILYIYGVGNGLRFVIEGKAKWSGKATYLPSGRLRLDVDREGEARTWELEHTRKGYWEGADLSGGFSILTPLYKSELEELSLANS